MCNRPWYPLKGSERSKTFYNFCRRVLGDLVHVSLSVEDLWEAWNMWYLLSAPDIPTTPQGDLRHVTSLIEEFLEIWNMLAFL